MITGQEIGGIIPFPVWIIPFSVLKTGVGEIIPFPVWIILFPIFKTSFKLVVKIEKRFVSFLIEVRK